MKTNTATTPEQSARLLRCGVSADTADMSIRTITEPMIKDIAEWETPILLTMPYGSAKDIYRGDHVQPAWSLSALMTKILPSNIRYEGHTSLLEITSSNWQSDEQVWEVAYDIDLGVEAPDPIEACVLMAEKLVANGYKLNEHK